MLRRLRPLTVRLLPVLVLSAALVGISVAGDSPVADDGLIAKGKSLIEAGQCVGCHQIGGKGGNVGPSLDDAIVKRDRNFLMQQLKDPRKNNPSTIMPKYGFTDEQIDSIIRYLASLQEKKA